ncbi:MAG TPA: HK97 gp10 family phage protein [Amycolatopsis sp.]|nr:HK97 gp10 family phage protein [Amycolatopsis sp.]
MAVGGRVIINRQALNELLYGRTGPVARMLEHQAERVTQEAKRLAPVSPVGEQDHPSGQLRSSIGWDLTHDGRQLVAEVRAETDYALYVEVGTRPHDITSHGDYPLRNPKTGAVFGRTVHHPGTKAQPYLRPSLDVIRGRVD